MSNLLLSDACIVSLWLMIIVFNQKSKLLLDYVKLCAFCTGAFQKNCKFDTLILRDDIKSSKCFSIMALDHVVICSSAGIHLAKYTDWSFFQVKSRTDHKSLFKKWRKTLAGFLVFYKLFYFYFFLMIILYFMFIFYFFIIDIY